ncbi:glutathione ABC transporter substrate-binding protein [Shouchella clausii]|uniref:glutathione ABC transporter substrate-binding protein n=1 Tax=Shouchella clausii TaxID=79880 RepID=UPI003981E920
MNVKKPFYGVMALTVAAGLAACSSEPDENTNTGDGGEGAEESGQGGDLVVAMNSDIVALDPHQVNDVPSGQVQGQVYEGLIEFDENMELQPVLAKGYEWNDDGTALTFQLQEGVKFHDGAEFNAEAVKKNIERITDEALASQRAFLFEEISEINVINDYEIEFVTEEPFAPLVYSFAHNAGFMISPDVIDADYAAMENGEQPSTEVNANPAGTGYFKYESGQIGSSELVFKKNEEYWGEPAKLDSVTFKTVPDGNTRLAELETGSSHFIEPLDVSGVAQLEATDGAHLLETESISASYFGFNVEKEPFDDVRVRQAIAMAIDKNVIANDILDGFELPATSPVSPGVIGHDPNAEPLPYDVDAAKELLAEAGYEDGFEVTLSTNDSAARVDLAQYIQNQLADLNITVDINIQEWATYLDATGNGEHEMFILGWSSATGDADYALAPLFHSDSMGEPGNRSFYSNPELDAILDEAAKEVDEDKRNELYAEAQAILNEEVPVVFTTTKNYLNGVRDEVKNIAVSPSGDFLFHDTYIEQ